MALERFKKAQDDPHSGFATALSELRAGRKTSHWIWYVLPQLAGLGRSDTARFYGLTDLAEATAYLRDQTLRERLLVCVETIAAKLSEGVPLSTLMGSQTDVAKLISCLTLFQFAANAIEPDAATAERARLIAACETALGHAERAGHVRCDYTLRFVRGLA